jgi:hypothetical protein
MQWLVDVALNLGWRPVERVEVGGEIAYGEQSVSAPGFSSERTGFGDATLRARWDAIDEPMPFEEPAVPYPSAGLVLGLRVPTGTLERVDTGTVQSGTTGALGTTASSQGLGAWEVNLGAVLDRRLSSRLRIGAVGELGYRFPDDSTGIERHLGPRALGVLSLTYRPSPLIGIAPLTDLGWEGDIAFDGETALGTGQRLWTIGVLAFLVPDRSKLRSGVMLRYAPPVEDINVNAVGATSFSVSLGYALE